MSQVKPIVCIFRIYIGYVLYLISSGLIATTVHSLSERCLRINEKAPNIYFMQMKQKQKAKQAGQDTDCYPAQPP